MSRDISVSPDPMVRARHGAASVGGRAPWDRVHYRLFHPALRTGSEQERQTGSLAPDPTLAPWPVVILCNGINVGPESYRWLAEALAAAGIATVTYSFIDETMPGEVGLSPGLDLMALTVDGFGTRPSATVIGPLLEALELENAQGPLESMIDLDRVVLGGHSAGGTVALLNARPDWFPGVVAAWSYAGHTMPAALLGHPEGTVLAVDSPALILGGTSDAVIAASVVRYRTAAERATHDPMTATFEQGATHPGSMMALIEGAGHLGLCHPLDPTTSRGFLEPAPTGDEPAQRAAVLDVLIAFLAANVELVGEMSTPVRSLESLADDPMIHLTARSAT